jgi:hypothetical protein
MPKVAIVIDETDAGSQLGASLRQAILQEDSTAEVALFSINALSEEAVDHHRLICPLTLELPASLVFPLKSVYQACRDWESLQAQVRAWHYETGVGDRWLPIVLTAKGPLYAEVIGRHTTGFVQPIHLTDRQRQPLYAFGHRLLRYLSASPAVYLVQFGFQEQSFCFDRLWPFPTEPAIASINVQSPHLFMCHWRCLMGQPIYDLVIKAV